MKKMKLTDSDLFMSKKCIILSQINNRSSRISKYLTVINIVKETPYILNRITLPLLGVTIFVFI